MMRTIWWDMDGTIANLYAVENWLPKLQAQDASPYVEAEVMWNMAQLARLMNKVQRAGYRLGIISWLSKCPTPEYDKAVTEAKLVWLNQHLHSVNWDEIHIVSYGTPKQSFMVTNEDILFDDEMPNREAWNGEAFDPSIMIEILKGLE